MDAALERRTWRTGVAPGRKEQRLRITFHGAARQVTGSAHLLEIGSRVPYADFHQTGTSIMPARPLSLSERVRVRAVKTVQRYVVEGGGGRGGVVARALGKLRSAFGR